MKARKEEKPAHLDGERTSRSKRAGLPHHLSSRLATILADIAVLSRGGGEAPGYTLPVPRAWRVGCRLSAPILPDNEAYVNHPRG